MANPTASPLETDLHTINSVQKTFPTQMMAFKTDTDRHTSVGPEAALRPKRKAAKASPPEAAGGTASRDAYTDEDRNNSAVTLTQQPQNHVEAAEQVAPEEGTEGPMGARWPGLPPPGPTHHLTRHWLSPTDKGDTSLERLGASTIKEAETMIKSMQQRELRAVFQRVYGTSTSSYNNNWLRRKLLEAVGSSQAGKKRKGPGRRTSGLELWERQERRDRAQAHSKTQVTTATAPAAAPDRRGGTSEEDRDEELESHRDAAAARTLAGIAAGWPG